MRWVGATTPGRAPCAWGALCGNIPVTRGLIPNLLKPRRLPPRGFLICKARWQSGHAAACKAVYAGSIPTLASKDVHWRP